LTTFEAVLQTIRSNVTHLVSTAGHARPAGAFELAALGKTGHLVSISIPAIPDLPRLTTSVAIVGLSSQLHPSFRSAASPARTGAVIDSGPAE
jgi:hypothetical protein